MEFYTSIHPYYDLIFPLNKLQIDFVLEEIKVKSELLDIGCATGNLAIKLAQKGMQVNAFDLDAEMISTAKQKSNSNLVNFRVGNMLHIGTNYSSFKFDGVLCFGNTIVHLTNDKFIDNFIEAVFSVLKKGGKFLFQILNYDYILNERINQLPVLENDQIRFIRNYEFLESGLLSFNTLLTIKKNNQQIENQIELYPITKNKLVEILNEKGFSAIEVFGSFAKNKLTETSLPLVVKAIK